MQYELKIYNNTLFELYILQFMCWLVSDSDNLNDNLSIFQLV